MIGRWVISKEMLMLSKHILMLWQNLHVSLYKERVLFKKKKDYSERVTHHATQFVPEPC
jgi:hypothetical protein